MKKQRRLSLNKVSVVSLRNMYAIYGGGSTVTTDDTSSHCPAGTTTGNSTGTTDTNAPTSNTFSGGSQLNTTDDTTALTGDITGCKINDLTD